MSELIRVKVIPKARMAGVYVEKDQIRVKVHAPAEKGKANVEVLNLLTDYFGIKRSDILLVDGETSQYKTFMIRNS